MKYRFLYAMAFMLSCIHYNNVKAQASEEEQSKEFYRADGNINLVVNELPAGWIFKEEKGFFIISRKDSVIVLAENRINAPSENRETRVKRIKEFGSKTKSTIVIRYEKKWDFLRIQEIQIKNAATIDEISKLADKMKITALLDPNLSRKNQAVYTAKTEAEKISMANYYKEKEKLEKKIVTIPDYNSQLYSLFIISKSGMDDDMHMVYPSEASVELYSILALFREACGK